MICTKSNFESFIYSSYYVDLIPTFPCKHADLRDIMKLTNYKSINSFIDQLSSTGKITGGIWLGQFLERRTGRFGLSVRRGLSEFCFNSLMPGVH